MATPILVLVEPQDIVNIAATVRIAKNFEIDTIRLVNPADYDPYRIEGIAHNTADVLARLEIVETLDEALADCHYAVALTARERTAKRQTLRAREAGEVLTLRAREGRVAAVFGRESKGLTNDELDRCHTLVSIATNPHYKSLNLAQAVSIVAYECWMAREGDDQARKPPRHEAEPATSAQYDHLFADWERALWAIEFFKTRRAESVMRSWREVMFRSALDGREATLVRAIGLEVVRFLERKGVPIPDAARKSGASPVPPPPPI